MPFFTNPFKKHDVSEFEGVLIPLEHAEHRSSLADGQRRMSITSQLSQQLSRKSDKNSEKASTDSSGGVHGGLTIETLKAEIEADLVAGESHTAYDSKTARTASSYIPLT
jgi:hypothetical protein